MSPIETSGAALTRGSPHNSSQSGFAVRSSADKAQTLQSVQTSTPAAPVETERAIAQAQAAAKTRSRAELSRPEPPRSQPSQAAQQPAHSRAAGAAPEPARESAPEQAARKSAQSAPPKENPSLFKPMTAVLLHELRLQQELASVQEEKSQQRA